MNEPPPRASANGVIGATIWGCAVASFQAALWILLCFILLKCEPMLEQVLAESDIELPALTQMFVTLARWFSRYWYLLPLIGMPLALVEVAIIACSKAWPGTWLLVLRYLLVAVFSLVPLLLLGWAILTMGLTIQIVTDGMSQQLTGSLT